MENRKKYRLKIKLNFIKISLSLLIALKIKCNIGKALIFWKNIEIFCLPIEPLIAKSARVAPLLRDVGGAIYAFLRETNNSLYLICLINYLFFAKLRYLCVLICVFKFIMLLTSIYINTLGRNFVPNIVSWKMVEYIWKLIAGVIATMTFVKCALWQWNW